MNIRSFEIKYISVKTGLTYHIFKLVNKDMIKVVCKLDGNILYEKYYDVFPNNISGYGFTFSENVDLLKVYNMNYLESFADDLNTTREMIQSVINKTY